MDTVEEISLTSSMVDDAFFIVKKCVRYILRFCNNFHKKLLITTSRVAHYSWLSDIVVCGTVLSF